MYEKKHESKGIEELRGEIKIVEKPLNPGYTLGVFSFSDELRKATDEGKLENFLVEFSTLYRDVYGRYPWKEYLVCTDPLCKTKVGLPDGKDIASTDKIFFTNPEEFCCEKCGNALEFFYAEKLIVDNVRRLLREKIFCCLTYESSTREIVGFSMGKAISIEDGYNDKLLIGTGHPLPPNYLFEEYMEEINSVLGHQYSPEHPAFNMAEWGIAKHGRKSGAGFALLHQLLLEAQGKMGKDSKERIPLIGHTLINSKAYDLIKKINSHGFGALRQGSEEVKLYGIISEIIIKIENLNKNK